MKLLCFLTTGFLLYSPLTYAGTDMVKAFGRTNAEVTKYCKKTFKSKKMEKDCADWWRKHVKKECSSKPYNKCFFDEKKLTYKGLADRKWTDIKKLIDKNFK